MILVINQAISGPVTETGCVSAAIFPAAVLVVSDKEKKHLGRQCLSERHINGGRQPEQEVQPVESDQKLSMNDTDSQTDRQTKI